MFSIESFSVDALVIRHDCLKTDGDACILSAAKMCLCLLLQSRQSQRPSSTLRASSQLALRLLSISSHPSFQSRFAPRFQRKQWAVSRTSAGRPVGGSKP